MRRLRFRGVTCFPAARGLSAALAILAALGGGGCGTVRRPLPAYREPLPPSEEIHRGLGLVGIVLDARSAQTELTGAPAKGAGEGARRGAAMGGLGSVVVGAASGDPRGAALGLAVAPLAAGIGAITGAIRARPAALVAEQESSIQKALTEGNIQERLRAKVLSEARRRTRYPVFVLNQPDEARPGDVLTELHVEVVSVVLEGDPHSIRSSASLVVVARLALRSPGRPDELYSSLLLHRSPTRDWDEWADKDATPAAAALEEALTRLAETMVERVFMLYVVGS